MFKLICTFIIFIPFSLFAQTQVQQNKPKLVVGIVIDQMRYDYLTKCQVLFALNKDGVHLLKWTPSRIFLYLSDTIKNLKFFFDLKSFFYRI